MTTIINLTPHPVTIIRDGHKIAYPACAPADLPRAVEAPTNTIMAIGESGDGQAGAANSESLDATGLVEYTGYIGVEGLTDPTPDELAFGCTTFRIVSIVTAIGALAAGRTIVDLLVPMGQIRDDSGKIIGAAGLAPAAALLSPLVERWIAHGVSIGRTIGRF